MLVTIKTLQQHIFKIDIDTSETVKALKTKIENERGKDTYPVAGQKLIYAGKILDDNKALSEYKIEEGKFIVAMVTKAKPAPKAADPPAKSSSPTTDASSSTPAPAAPTPAPVTTSPSTETTPAQPAATTAAPAPANPPAATNPSSTLVTSENYETTVQNIIALGFPREHVETALSASFNNPDRAVEYLMGEIPPSVLQAAAAQQQQQGGQAAAETPAANPAVPAAPAAPASGVDGGSSIAELVRSNPQLQTMIEQVRNNPSILHGYMERIGLQNPELLTFISEHQQEFVNYINNPNAINEAAAPPTGGGGGGAAPADAPEGTNYIAVTPRERDEINQLKAMGFSELDSLQAYIACGKDLALAINFLISSGSDGM